MTEEPKISVTIIGLGLMGGSMGLALTKSQAVSTITGVDLNQDILDKASRIGAINQGTTDPVQGCTESDLVILATPVTTIPEITQQIMPHMKQNAVITDFGSTKQFIYDKINTFLNSHDFCENQVTYVGSHPMTGREQSGIDAADPGLFKEKPFIICPPLPSTPWAAKATKLITRIACLAGALPLRLNPEEHDNICAFTSHLQHLIAISLVDGLRTLATSYPHATKLVAGSFKDATRVASSDPNMSGDILITNLPGLGQALTLLTHRISALTRMLKSGDQNALRQELNEIKTFRDSLFPNGGIEDEN